MELEKLKQIAEAALLAADEPLSVDQLVKLFRPGEVDGDTIRADLREALKALIEEAEGRGYELVQVASGYRYQVRQELSTWISRLWEEKPPRYSRALLETLALVAYKQPVTRGDIEQVRGVSVSQSIMRTLLERSWIRVVGQREVPGRPSMYGTTREFLDYFSLKSLDQLPPLAEIRELIEPVIVEEFESGEIGPLEDEAAAAEDSPSIDVGEADADSEAEGGGDETTAEEGATEESDNLAAKIAESLDSEESVDLDSDDFEAEIAQAIAAADAASARFNNSDPEPDSESAAEPLARSDEPADGDSAEHPERAQVVDVVTGLDSEVVAEEAQSAGQAGGAAQSGVANAGAEAEEDAEQTPPTAEVVQLPRAPH